MKRNALRWYGHVPRMHEDRLTKKVYDSKREGNVGRGRPIATWEKRVREFVEERAGRGGRVFERASEIEMCKDKITWRHFCHLPPLVREFPGGNKALAILID
ncbi:hypothetical protein Hamer_G001401 [Homarus americanus]|uniref:Uncharacterized protein n=1 Tax=Homarus americanus TaxID=6706 RepID=A0A8J5N7S6_HOMAM|nr:hypothetical protein Hamer_G001401 [Homarus americanus]